MGSIHRAHSIPPPRRCRQSARRRSSSTRVRLAVGQDTHPARTGSGGERSALATPEIGKTHLKVGQKLQAPDRSRWSEYPRSGGQSGLAGMHRGFFATFRHLRRAAPRREKVQGECPRRSRVGFRPSFGVFPTRPIRGRALTLARVCTVSFTRTRRPGPARLNS